MKLPFILRKKYNAIQNKNLKLMNDKYDLESELYLLGLKYKDLKEEVKTLRNDLKEKDKIYEEYQEMKEDLKKEEGDEDEKK